MRCRGCLARPCLNAWKAVSLSIDACDTQILANVEEEWMKQRNGVLMDVETEGGGEHQICSFMWADNFWIISHSKKQLEQMLKDLIEGAAEGDLEPKPASLWWTSTYASEEKEEMSLGT